MKYREMGEKSKKLDMIHPGRAKLFMSFQVILFLLFNKTKANNARSPTIPFGTAYLLSSSKHEKGKLSNFFRHSQL